MAASLREQIRKYETEKKTKLSGPVWPHMRCLYCPLSFFNCSRAKKSMEARKE